MTAYKVNPQDVQVATYRDWRKRIVSTPTGEGEVWQDGQLVSDGFLHVVSTFTGLFLEPQGIRQIAGPFKLRIEAIKAARAAWESEDAHHDEPAPE